MSDQAQLPDPPVKRPYRAPELRDLGRLSELTLAGGPNPRPSDAATYTS